MQKTQGRPVKLTFLKKWMFSLMQQENIIFILDPRLHAYQSIALVLSASSSAIVLTEAGVG